MKQFSLPKSRRLAGERVFKGILARKLHFRNELLVLTVAENACGWPRFAIRAAKSLGGAVQRNRLKRLAREVFRRNQHQIPSGFDYLLSFSKEALKLSGSDKITFTQVQDAFRALIEDASRKIKR